MCIAIANLKGNPISKKWFMNSWENNSHGGGLLYKEQGVLKQHYELTDPEAFYKVYRKKINKSNVLLHFRIASKGVKTVDNCHPYMVSPELGFIHNGTIYTGLEDYGKEKSDTWAYNKQILKHLPPDFYMYPVLCNILESKIGNSKLAFMDDEEVITIIGDSKGEAHYDEKTGNWFSNKSYQQVNDFEWKGDIKVKKQNYNKWLPKPPTTALDRCPTYPYDTEYFTWGEDLAKKCISPGFENTMLELAEESRKYSKFKDGVVMMEQFISFRGRWNTIRRAMTRVFEEFLYRAEDRDLINCIRYYIHKNSTAKILKAKENWKKQKETEIDF